MIAGEPGTDGRGATPDERRPVAPAPWPDAPLPWPPPAGNDVHLWRVSLDRVVPAGLRASLSDAERTRADRFHAAADRDRFVASRGVLRAILSRYLGRDPARLRFAYGPRGKPSLAAEPGGGDLRFNLAHAGGLALYAVTHGREVGVDLEHVRVDLDVEETAAVVCSPRERAALAALPPARRYDAFVRLWVCKEAYAKAVGLGLSMSPERIEVTPEPGLRGAILVDGATPPGSWHVRTLVAAPDHAAALVVSGSAPRLVCQVWPDAAPGDDLGGGPSFGEFLAQAPVDPAADPC